MLSTSCEKRAKLIIFSKNNQQIALKSCVKLNIKIVNKKFGKKKMTYKPVELSNSKFFVHFLS